MGNFIYEDLELISKMEEFNLERFKEIWIQKLNPEKFDSTDDYDQLVDEINETSDYEDLFNVLSRWSIIDIRKRINEFIKDNHIYLID